MGLDRDYALEQLEDDILWMALSRSDPTRGVAEPGAGYERQLVVPGDWAGGLVSKTFGPARETWFFTYVALLRSDGTPVYWVTLSPVSVEVGRAFTFDLELEVSAA